MSPLGRLLCLAGLWLLGRGTTRAVMRAYDPRGRLVELRAPLWEPCPEVIAAAVRLRVIFGEPLRLPPGWRVELVTEV